MNRSSMNTSDDVLWLTSFDVPINLQPIPLATQIFRLSTTVVGLLLNGFLLMIFSCSRQLHSPRHLFWPALALIDFFCLLQPLVEIVAIVHKNQIACQMYVLNAGVGYSLLLLCLAFTALDRYLSIVKHEWYKRRITNRVVLTALCGSSAVTYILITSPFWTGYKKISACTVNLTHMNIVLSWNLLLGIVCFVLHINIYIRSRALIRNCPPQHLTGFPLTYVFKSVTNPSNPVDCQGFPVVDNLNSTNQVSTDNPRQHNENVDIDNDDEGIEIATQHRPQPSSVAALDPPAANVSNQKNNCFPWERINPNKINAYEIRAAITMSINSLPFWVCTFPITCNTIALYWCIRFEYDCSIIFTIGPYLRNIFMFHGIYNPLMYMLTNREFRQALARFLKNKCVSYIFCCITTRTTTHRRPNVRGRFV